MLLTNGAYAVTAHVTNVSVRSQTNQPLVSSLKQQRRLKLFGHIARAAASKVHSLALRASTDRLPVDWGRPRGRPRQDLASNNRQRSQTAQPWLHSALRRATDRTSWRRIVETAICSSSVPPGDDDDERAVGDIHQPFFYRYNTFENSTAQCCQCCPVASEPGFEQVLVLLTYRPISG